VQTFAGTLASIDQAAFKTLPASCIVCIAANLSASRYIHICISVLVCDGRQNGQVAGCWTIAPLKVT